MTDEPKCKPASPEERAKQVDAVIELIEAGESERSACKQVGMNHSTFRQAVGRHNVSTQYARALEAMAHAQVVAGDKTVLDMLSGSIDANQARVALDWQKWCASKLFPRQYGDRVQQVHTGADGGAVKVEQISPLDEIEERLTRLAERESAPVEAKPGLGRVIN